MPDAFEPFPPIDFPIFGMGASWTGPRWLELLEGQRGSPTWGVWLAHRKESRPTDGSPWSTVITYPRVRHANEMAPGQTDHDRELAFAAAIALINLTMPDLVGRRSGLAGALVDHAGREADRLAEWQTTDWLIDGHTTVAKIWPWADAWAGLAVVSAEIAVAVLGHGFDPGSVRVFEVRDTTAYHFAMDEPVHFAGTLDASRRAALGHGAAGPDVAWPWHPDHGSAAGE